MAKNKRSIQISEEAWKAYTDKLYNVSATAGKKMEEYILKHGLEDRNALIDYAYGIVTKYSEGTSALAAQMYDEIAAAENALTLSAEVIATPSYGEVAKTVHGTLKKSKNEKSLGGAIQYLVKRTGADTTLHNALRDHAQFAWIPGTGETCSFCRMLASNGWRYMSKKALKNGHAEHIHANCRCTYAIRFSEQSNINGYDPDKLYQEYVDSGRDVNEMRRLQYKNNKELAEKIKEQKREAYAKRKAIESSQDSDILKIQDIRIPGNAGAMHQNTEIRLPDGTKARLTPGSRIEKAQVIAGNGRKRKIDMVDVLVSAYEETSDTPELWQKCKGFGLVDFEGESYKAEIHWYKHPKVGNVRYKVKPDEGGNWFYED